MVWGPTGVDETDGNLASVTDEYGHEFHATLWPDDEADLATFLRCGCRGRGHRPA